MPGNITIATNMAGRGTDIKLGPGVKEAGGLAIIGTENMRAGALTASCADVRDAREIPVPHSSTFLWKTI